jgi:hypothetical protein
MTRVSLIYVSDDRLIVDQITAELTKTGVSVRDGGSADVAVPVLSARALADSRFQERVVQTRTDKLPLFILYMGNEAALRGDLPSELSFLRFNDWYDAADTPSWVSAFIEAFMDAEYLDDGLFDRGGEGGEVVREIPSSAWEEAKQDELAESAGKEEKEAERGWTHAKPPEPEPEFAPPSSAVPPPAQTVLPQPGPPATETGVALAVPAEPIAFSSYYPKEAKPDVWLPLMAYIYKDSAAGIIKQDAMKELGAMISAYRPVSDGALVPIAEGAVITATPTLEGFQFNPPSAQIAFYKDWHRLDFEMRAKTAPLDESVNGRITFTIEGVIAADLPLSVFVSESAAMGAGRSPQPAVAEAKPYQAIFCSYSHKDTKIVERVERAIKLLGHTFLRDATTLRSGEDWNAALMAMIDRADIFQLFWSTAAAGSKYVQEEWEYALRTAQQRGLQIFIRPVYWEEPMPKPPSELGAIHFAFDPTLDDNI